jgi:hypothetical protein
VKKVPSKSMYSRTSSKNANRGEPAISLISYSESKDIFLETENDYLEFLFDTEINLCHHLRSYVKAIKNEKVLEKVSQKIKRMHDLDEDLKYIKSIVKFVRAKTFMQLRTKEITLQDAKISVYRKMILI